MPGLRAGWVGKGRPGADLSGSGGAGSSGSGRAGSSHVVWGSKVPKPGTHAQECCADLTRCGCDACRAARDAAAAGYAGTCDISAGLPAGRSGPGSYKPGVPTGSAGDVVDEPPPIPAPPLALSGSVEECLDPTVARAMRLGPSASGSQVPDGQPAPSGAKASTGGDDMPVSEPSGVRQRAVLATASGSSGPENPEGDAKRRRTEGASGPAEAAAEWMSSVFGSEWRGKFHTSHRLSLARPLVYCKCCGYHTESSQHLVKLRDPCQGEPLDGSALCYRRRAILKGKHPTKGKELAPPVPLMSGLRP